MKICKKILSLSSSILLFSSTTFAVNNTSVKNVSIKKDSDLTVPMQTKTEEKQKLFNSEKEEEKVSKSDVAPNDAEINENPEYKDKADKINESDIFDSETNLPVAKDAPKTESVAEPKITDSDYKGEYTGSIRTIKRKPEVSQKEDKKEKQKQPEITEEIKNTETEESKTEISEVKNTNLEEQNTQTEEKTTEQEVVQLDVDDTENTEDSEGLVDIVAEIVPSRSVEMKNGQYLEVTYPGKGWSFIGDDESKELMSFMGRKLTQGDTTFTLRSKKAGETKLHFYKKDSLTNFYIDDYLLVTILDEMAKGSEKNQKIIAPSYAEIVPPKPNRVREEVSATNAQKQLSETKQEEVQEEKKDKVVETRNTVEKTQKVTQPEKNIVTETENEGIKTNIQTTIPTNSKTKENVKVEDKTEKPELTVEKKTEEQKLAEVEKKTEADENVDNLFEKAKQAFKDKKYTEALDLTQRYLDISTTDTDEVLFLLGQLYESESEIKNIKSSIAAYDTLVKNYPTSNFWQAANQRVIYLKRFYVDIR